MHCPEENPRVGAGGLAENEHGADGRRHSPQERRRGAEKPDSLQTQRTEVSVGGDVHLHHPLSQVRTCTFHIALKIP